MEHVNKILERIVLRTKRKETKHDEAKVNEPERLKKVLHGNGLEDPLEERQFTPYAWRYSNVKVLHLEDWEKPSE